MSNSIAKIKKFLLFLCLITLLNHRFLDSFFIGFHFQFASPYTPDSNVLDG
jgi:hypothetical protein